MNNYNKYNSYRIKEKRYVGNCEVPKDENCCKVPCQTESNCCKKPCHTESNCFQTESNCCAKDEFKSLLQLISKPDLSNYVDFTTFTLYTMSTSTAQDATTINNLSFCFDNSIINYSDGSDFNTVSICDLTAISFQLVNPSVNLPIFSQCLREIIRPSMVKNTCRKEDKDDDCCCNGSKASLLASNLGGANLYVSGALGSLLNARVLAITGDVAILTQTSSTGSPAVPTTKIYFVDLADIELLG